MDDPKLKRKIEAIKAALLTEVKGQQLYAHATTQVPDAAAKAMFEALARDEEEHIAILKRQYHNVMEKGRIDLSVIHPAEVDHGAASIISDAFRRSVKRGTFELAVVGIGCDLENRSIAFYREQAAKAEDPDLRKIFAWLAEWEVGHLEQLLSLEQMMQDAYWAEQGFSPM